MSALYDRTGERHDMVYTRGMLEIRDGLTEGYREYMPT
jgi:hypothetical protein